MNTCGDCKHWCRLPANPAALTAPARGECRGGPPQLILLPTPDGSGAVLQVMYPATPEGFPACGRFAAPLDPAQKG